MTKKFYKAFAFLLSVAIFLATIPFSSVISAQALNFSNTEFDYATQQDFDSVWETVAGNLRTSATPTATTSAKITKTEDGKSAISAALSTTRASMMTSVKSDYFKTDSRIEQVTAKIKVETLSTGALKNADGAPGIYALHLNEYKSAVLQLGEYFNNADTTDANNGKITLQWSLFYYDESAINDAGIQ